ncbi:MAG: NAD(P)(+) transhydrogenase (Re/Si-specific) subunit beta [Myxococcota bacterium]
MSNILIQFCYLLAAVLFILGLRGLTSAKTAARGNALAALGMLVAVVAVLLDQDVVDFPTVLAGIALGSALGAVLALRIQMTAMPQMVAVLNGLGGAASALVASTEIVNAVAGTGPVPEGVVPLAVALSVLVGSLTLTGSLVAFAKLQELVGGAAVVYPLQRTTNALMGAAAIAVSVLFIANPLDPALLLGLVALALLLGVLLVIPIGGADMPVVISLLNSYSGIAACATGFVLDNSALVISGALVGASGLILTKIMCDAMNRSLVNVLFGGFGAKPSAGGTEVGVETRTAIGYTPEDAAMIFSNARSVIIVPGYGMAVAQAQHVVREFSEVLREKGIRVQFAIHPVAGRMPGHMNVLLAEANVPYEELVEMDDINPQFVETDVALVIGANDVVNPAAREDTASPIYGMPILDVDRSQHVFVLKRSMNPGFAGIQNELFFNDNTMMIFGDAKATVLKLVEAVRSY